MNRHLLLPILAVFLLLSFALVDRAYPMPSTLSSGPLLISTQPPEHQEATPSQQVAYALAVLLFGTILVVLQIYVMVKNHKHWDAWSTKLVGLTLVVTAGLFLIPAGYSQEQIAPLVGLLGTITGYLLGWEGKDRADHK